MGLVLVTLTVGFKCEHVLAGVGINIFASGITIVLLEMIWGTKGKSSMVAGLGMLRVPVDFKIPVIGDIRYPFPLFYILVLCVFLLWFLLYGTPAGPGESWSSEKTPRWRAPWESTYIKCSISASWPAACLPP